jgi:quercetin dioxygenase-like cupin family protein
MTSPADTARAQMEHARPADHGRSAHTLHRAHDRALRQTVVALRAGTTLRKHHSSREATLQARGGRIRLTASTQTLEAITATRGSHGPVGPGANPLRHVGSRSGPINRVIMTRSTSGRRGRPAR